MSTAPPAHLRHLYSQGGANRAPVVHLPNSFSTHTMPYKKKTPTIEISATVKNPLEVSFYLALMTRDRLRALCSSFGLPTGKLKGDDVDRLSAHIVRNGAALRVTVNVPKPKP